MSFIPGCEFCQPTICIGRKNMPGFYCFLELLKSARLNKLQVSLLIPSNSTDKYFKNFNELYKALIIKIWRKFQKVWQAISCSPYTMQIISLDCLQTWPVWTRTVWESIKKKFCISEPHSYAKDQINIYTSFWVAIYTPDILNSFFSQRVLM